MPLEQQYDESVILNIAALAANDMISVGGKIDATREVGVRVIKSEGWFFGRNLADDEQVIVGIQPISSAAEAEAGIEADPQSPFEVTTQGLQHSRAWFPIGVLMGPTGTSPWGAFHFKNEIPWSYPEGAAMSYGVYNPDDAALSSVAQELIGFVKHQVVWLRD